MRISFDAQIFCAQQYGGISRYYSSLATAMWNSSVRARIVAPLYVNAYLERLPHGLVRGIRLRGSSRASSAVRLASIGCGWLMDQAMRPDIVHRTYYYPVPRAPRSARTVLTVYDMIHEKFPDDFPRSDPIARWKAQAVAKADHLICISHHTRNDLIRLCGVDPAKTSVTHLGFDSLCSLPGIGSAAAFRSQVFGTDVAYLLYVGARTRYKNFQGLLQSFAASPVLRQSYRILCFGGGRFTTSEQLEIAAAGVADRVLQIGGGDEVLADCYRYAALFVYPSLYEGFGIPPLEAMSLGCPVACSNNSSIPEVVGDAAMLFDPLDSQSIRNSLETALASESVRHSLVARGHARQENFSWERCAAETLHIYRALLDRTL